MKTKDDGNSDSKGRAVCFVVIQTHAQECAEAAAQDGDKKQGFFGNAVGIPDGFVFVDAKEGEGQEIEK